MPTHSPGARKSFVRTPMPASEMSTVVAEASSLNFSALSTKLTGIFADSRSHWRRFPGVLGCINHSPFFWAMRLGTTKVTEIDPECDRARATFTAPDEALNRTYVQWQQILHEINS